MNCRPASQRPPSLFSEAVRSGRRHSSIVRALRILFVILLIGGTAIWRHNASADEVSGTDTASLQASTRAGFTQTTTVAPQDVLAGASTEITTAVTVMRSSLVNGIIDIEVYDGASQRVGQQYFTGQTIGRGQTVTQSYRWTSQAAGTYRVAIGVLGASWQPAYLWAASAATITVTSSAPTSTATSAATATRTNTTVPPTNTSTATAVPPTATGTTVPPSSTKTAIPATGTSTSTAAPPSATATTVASAPAFTQVTTANPVGGGSSFTINTTVTDMAGTLANAIIDIEVYNTAYQRVGQQFFANQNLGKGQSVGQVITWTAPAAGTYMVAVGVFGPNWAPNYLWVLPAASFAQGTATATATGSNTAVPATRTGTATAVPPTATGTAVPPSSTRTPVTATATNTKTPVPPSATSTSTPVPPTGTSTSVPPTATATTTAMPNGTPAWPLKVSATGRYLVDQHNVPFLMVGDSPHDMIGKLSTAEAAAFLADRQAHGFNSAAIYLLCNGGTGCSADGTTYDGIAPFTVPGDLSTPNEAYFARADAMIRQAAQDGITVLLDPIETTGWLATLQANGTTKDFQYGVYLGNRYKSFPNIIWYSGNDFQTWNTSGDRAVVQAVANGIKSVDPNHIHTAELNYYGSDTYQDPSWVPIAALNAAYTYYPTYAEVLTGYNRNQGPVFMVEASYEDGGQNGNVGTLNVLRRQEYWTMLSGATGQLYGSYYTRHFDSGWQAHLDSPGVTQLSYVTSLFGPRSWYTLVPDQNHSVVTAGYGTFSSSGLVKDSDYLTAARTPDGSLALAYLPTVRTVTVNMAQMAGPVTARWFDPSNGAYSAIPGSPLANTGTHQFTPTGNNSAGDGDWVLVLETQGQAPTSTATATGTATRTPTPGGPTSTPTPGTAAPVFVQEQDARTTSGTTVSSTLLAAVGSGHTLLAYLIWDGQCIASITDSRGDSYTAIAAPLAWGSGRSAQAFVAKGVSGGATTATVTFCSAIPKSALLYFMDYAGANTANPIDGTTEAAGTGNSLNSGTIATTQANDLLVGVGASDGSVTAPGTGYSIRSTFNGNVTEDMIATSTGSYGATAAHTGTAWTMQVVALHP